MRRDESWFEDGGAAGGWTQTGKEVMDDSRINPPLSSFTVYSLNLYRTGSKAEPKDNVTFLSCNKTPIYFLYGATLLQNRPRNVCLYQETVSG